jgi:adenylate kinase
MVNILSDKKFYNRLIFHGYPRNLNQAKSLDLLLKKYNQKISCVLSLNIDKEAIVKRILGRQICSNCGLIFNKYFKLATNKNHTCDPKFLSKRSDDNEKTIINRFETYLGETLPILNFYKEQNLLQQINGMGKIVDISEEIRGIIASIET